MLMNLILYFSIHDQFRKIFIGTVISFFSLSREKAGGKLSGFAVIFHAFAAYSLPGTGISTVAVFQILFFFTFHLLFTSLYR